MSCLASLLTKQLPASAIANAIAVCTVDIGIMLHTGDCTHMCNLLLPAGAEGRSSCCGAH
jgi:hypothetical protein